MVHFVLAVEQECFRGHESLSVVCGSLIVTHTELLERLQVVTAIYYVLV